MRQTKRSSGGGRGREGGERQAWGFLSSPLCSLIKAMTQAQETILHTHACKPTCTRTATNTHSALWVPQTITKHFAIRPQLLNCITLSPAFTSLLIKLSHNLPSLPLSSYFIYHFTSFPSQCPIAPFFSIHTVPRFFLSSSLHCCIHLSFISSAFCKPLPEKGFYVCKREQVCVCVPALPLQVPSGLSWSMFTVDERNV